jgi:hypothetical protein
LRNPPGAGEFGRELLLLLLLLKAPGDENPGACWPLLLLFKLAKGLAAGSLAGNAA